MKKRYELYLIKVNVLMEGGRATKYILEVYPKKGEIPMPLPDGIDEGLVKAMNTFNERKKETRIFIEWDED